jgi:2-polyprenyl-3-methyl-5-hydroxy-6-metoxy-1,4-benzoquinol methylase
MQKRVLEETYRTHHERGDRYGYLFCNGARSPYLKRWIGQGKKVLDLGCRDGMLTQSFSKGNEVIGVDIDKQALKLCEKKLAIETQWIDLNTEWPWENSSFDAIVSCEIIEHLYTLERFLENVANTLKPNGIYIGSVPNAFRMRNRLKFLFGKEYETDSTHVRQFSYEKLQNTLARYFSHIEIVALGGKVFPFVDVTEATPKTIARLFAKDLLWRCSSPVK